MVTEHIHTPEVSTDLLLNGATDFARPDPDYDCGITGSMKIATAAEALGMDTGGARLRPRHAPRDGRSAQIQLLRGQPRTPGCRQRLGFARLRLRL